MIWVFACPIRGVVPTAYAADMDATVTAAAIGVGGSVIVALAGFWANVRNTNKASELTLRALELTAQGQVTDRYTKAIEQLDSQKGLDVRIGGIYALERMARESPSYHPTVIEVLAAIVREHSRERWPEAEPGGEPPERRTRPDVQAAVTVIGRRNREYDDRRTINLAGATLPRADLIDANLSGAALYGTDLSGAELIRADLSGANLRGAILSSTILNNASLRQADLRGAKFDDALLGRANLRGALLRSLDFHRAYLSHADLADANLIHATFPGSKLHGAILTGADLTGAVLGQADFTEADFTGAKLTGADFTGAELTSARYPEGCPVPEGWVRDADSGRLSRAKGASGAGN